MYQLEFQRIFRTSLTSSISSGSFSRRINMHRLFSSSQRAVSHARHLQDVRDSAAGVAMFFSLVGLNP